jgi:hypothetical protein
MIAGTEFDRNTEREATRAAFQFADRVASSNIDMDTRSCLTDPKRFMTSNVRPAIEAGLMLSPKPLKLYETASKR